MFPFPSYCESNMAEQVPVEQDVESFEHMPRTGGAGSYGRLTLSFLRVLYSDFDSGCTSLQSHSRRGFFFPCKLTSTYCLLFVWL